MIKINGDENMCDENNKPGAYHCIRLWHRSSMPYYWKRMQQEASEEGAPIDAVYKDTGSSAWVLLRNVQNASLVQSMACELARIAAK
jgi:hypothetical protein